MSRWNHFHTKKYATVLFADVPVGSKFRRDAFNGKRRRKDIICIKTGELEFMEQKSKSKHKVYHDKFNVCSFDALAKNEINQPLK